MKLNNYKILFIFRIIKTILNLFLDSFFVLYFITLSNNNILPFGIYKLISITLLYLTILLLRNRCKSKNRVNLLRTGLIIYFLYFILLIILRDNIVKYMYLIGIIYGIQEGFYYSIFNILESDSITNQERTKYNGKYKIISNIISFIFPIICGSLIAVTSFNKFLVIILLLLMILIIISFKIKDSFIPKDNKVKLREYLDIIKTNKAIINIYNTNVFSGLTYSSGAFLSIITIYIISVYNNSISLGIYSSIICLIVAILSFLFGYIIKKDKYINIILITSLSSIISLIIMIYNCNLITIVIFNILSKINWEFIYLVNITSQGNLTNINEIKDKYKVEFYQFYELSLFIARFISFILFILMSFISVNYILPIFIVFLLLLMFNSIRVQKYMK